MQRNHHNSLNAAFTLVELSIVVVIVGLVIGTAISSMQLVKNAELRSLITQKEQIMASAAAFRTKYGCIPGDCTNATFLGFSMGNGNPYDGNGDDKIDDPGGYLFACCGSVPKNEKVMFWKSLLQSGFLAGKYPYPPNDAVYYYGYPANLRLNAWVPSTSAYAAGGWPAGSVPLGNVLGLVGPHTRCGYWTCGGAIFSEALRPEEAYGIDAKVDDGLPFTGLVQAAQGSQYIDVAPVSGDQDSCTLTWSLTATYVVPNNTVYAMTHRADYDRCNLNFQIPF